jgi:hypothetical protein
MTTGRSPALIAASNSATSPKWCKRSLTVMPAIGDSLLIRSATARRATLGQINQALAAGQSSIPVTAIKAATTNTSVPRYNGPDSCILRLHDDLPSPSSLGTELGANPRGARAAMVRRQPTPLPPHGQEVALEFAAVVDDHVVRFHRAHEAQHRYDSGKRHGERAVAIGCAGAVAPRANRSGLEQALQPGAVFHLEQTVAELRRVLLV